MTSRFYWACARGYTEVAQEALISASTEELNVHTGMCLACKFGHIDIVKLLMKFGASGDSRGNIEIFTEDVLNLLDKQYS